MNRHALLLGRPDHPNVVALCDELPRHGLEPRVLDPRLFPASSTLSVALGPRGPVRARIGALDLAETKVGWFSSAESVRLAPGLARAARPFARAAAIAGLVALRQAHGFAWVNDPWRALASSDKLLQLRLARERGLAIPETLLTSDPREFRAFVRKHRAAAVKSPSGSAGVPESRRVLTSRVTTNDISDAESVRLAPVLAQEYVEKRTEVRATVVGAKVFAVEIHSQEKESTRIDWRHYEEGMRYTKLELPAPVRRACAAIVKDCGLDYSGVDLIRTPQDEYVFLEANSEPAWLWLEDATGLPITRAIGALLARRSRP